MQPPLRGAAVVDAGRAEACTHFQGGHRVASLVPGRGDSRLPGGHQAGKASAVVTLPDPLVVHDRLVVVADHPAELRPDPGQLALLGRPHARAAPVRVTIRLLGEWAGGAMPAAGPPVPR